MGFRKNIWQFKNNFGGVLWMHKDTLIGNVHICTINSAVFFALQLCNSFFFQEQKYMKISIFLLEILLNSINFANDMDYLMSQLEVMPCSIIEKGSHSQCMDAVEI